jgi:hypothetical protein
MPVSSSARNSAHILSRALKYPIPDKYKQAMPNRCDDTPKVKAKQKTELKS